MKRIITLILAAAVLLSLASCGTGNETTPTAAPTAAPTSEPTAETKEEFYVVDCSDFLSVGSGNTLIAETENSIYFIQDAWKQRHYMIWFSDKETHDWMPLCGRPNCRHNDADCNAWFEGDPRGSIWLYGDHIYYIEDNSIDMTYSTEYDMYPELWRMKLDGTDHERLLKIDLSEPMDEIRKTGSTYEYSFGWSFHNRYAVVHFWGNSGDGRNEEDDIVDFDNYNDTRRFWNYVIDLSENKPKQREIAVHDRDGNAIPLTAFLAGHGDTLFCGHDRSIYSVNLASGESRFLCELPFETYVTTKGSYEDGKIWFCDGWDEGIIISVDAETGEITEVNSAEPQERMWYHVVNGRIFGTDYPYEMELSPEVLEMFRENGIEVPQKKYPDRFCTDIFDLYGSLIVNIPHEAYGDIRIGIGHILGDIVFGYEGSESGGLDVRKLPEYYLDLRELGTDSFGWKKWNP